VNFVIVCYRHKRASRISKSSSMPKHPAPPVPRMVSEETINHRARPGDLYDEPAPHVSHYDVPKALHSISTSDSFESMASLDIDLSDIIMETDRRFDTNNYQKLSSLSSGYPQNPDTSDDLQETLSNCIGSAESGYLEPLSVKQSRNIECTLLHELYRSSSVTT